MIYFCVCLPLSTADFSKIEVMSHSLPCFQILLQCLAHGSAQQCLSEFFSCIQAYYRYAQIQTLVSTVLSLLIVSSFFYIFHISFLSSIVPTFYKFQRWTSFLLNLPGRSRPSLLSLILTDYKSLCWDYSPTSAFESISIFSWTKV